MQLLGYSLGLLWSQAWISRYNYKLTVIINSSIALIGSIFLSLAIRLQYFGLAYLANFIWGLADNYLCVSLMLYDHFPQNLGLAYGITGGYYVLVS